MAQKTDTPWVRIAQSMPNHPKIMPLSDKAFRTLIEMICYSAQYELDGKLPAGLAERLWNMDALEELMTNSSAAPSLAKRDSMYVIHGYEDMQETSNEIAAKREILRENGRKGGRPTAKPKPNDNQAGFDSENQTITNLVSETEPDDNQLGFATQNQTETKLVSPRKTKTKAEEEKEEEVEEEKEIHSPLTPLKGGTCATAQDFTDFYDAYPRHVGRKDAERAFHRAAKTVSPQTIIDAARRLAADPNLPDKQFIPHPATWLNQGRWDDEPLPERHGGRGTYSQRTEDAERAEWERLQALEAQQAQDSGLWLTDGRTA